MNPAAVIAAVVVGTPIVLGVAKFFWDMRSERQRNAPVVLAHETRKRYSDTQNPAHGGDAVHAVDAFIRNEGERAAFNIRFGVELRGIRYAYRLRDDDPVRGNRQPVLRPGERLPVGRDYVVVIPLLTLIGANGAGEGDPDAGRVYWARYENAQGHTYETRNPGDRSANLDIRRVWFPSRREKREVRAWDEARERGVQWEKDAREELLRGLEDTAGAR